MSTRDQNTYGGASGQDDGGLTTGGDGREEMAQAQNQVPTTGQVEGRESVDGRFGDTPSDEDDGQMQQGLPGGDPTDDAPELGSMGTDITGGSGQGGMVAGNAAGVAGSSITGDAVGAAAGADLDPAASQQGSDMSDQTPGYGNMGGYGTAGESDPQNQSGAPGSDGTSGMSSEGMNSGGAGSGSASYGGGQQQGGQMGGQQQTGQEQQTGQQQGFKTQGERDGEDYADDLGDGASASSAGGGL